MQRKLLVIGDTRSTGGRGSPAFGECPDQIFLQKGRTWKLVLPSTTDNLVDSPSNQQQDISSCGARCPSTRVDHGHGGFLSSHLSCKVHQLPFERQGDSAGRDKEPPQLKSFFNPNGRSYESRVYIKYTLGLDSISEQTPWCSDPHKPSCPTRTPSTQLPDASSGGAAGVAAVGLAMKVSKIPLIFTGETMSCPDGDKKHCVFHGSQTIYGCGSWHPGHPLAGHG